MKKINKKASKWMSPYMFFIFAFVGVFVAIGVFLFYSIEVDLREEETNLLTAKLADCLTKEGKFFIPQEGFNYYSECKLNQEIINNGNYYIKINLIKGGETEKIFETGVKDFRIRCALEAEGELPKCRETNLVINQEEQLNIFVASNNLGEKI